jgi:dethiobiotin synthase
VGKTVVCAALARAEVEAGRRVAYCKPVQTGLAPGEPGDADYVAATACVPVTEGLRLEEALAPAVAAERAGIPIDVDALVSWCRHQADAVDVLLVEGAGGLLVPLSGQATMADLATRLGAELVVATRPGLGTLNHTALTLEAARARDLRVAGLVICGWPAEPGITETTNLERLAAMGPILGVVPAVPGLDTAVPDRVRRPALAIL